MSAFRSAVLMAARRRNLALGIVPDHAFTSGNVGAWISARGGTSLNATSNALVVTKLGSTDGCSINLAGLITSGNWRLRIKLITTGSSTRLIIRTSPDSTHAALFLTLYDNTPTAGGVNIDFTFTNSSNVWFGLISTWTNGATEFSIDDVILEKL